MGGGFAKIWRGPSGWLRVKHLVRKSTGHPMEPVYPYLALILSLGLVTLAVRANGGGIFIGENRLIDTDVPRIPQYGFVALEIVSILLATVVLVMAYLTLSWPLVLGLHVLVKTIAFLLGSALWSVWDTGGRAHMAEIGLFHILSIAGSLWLSGYLF